MFLSRKAQGDATRLAGAPTNFSKFRHETARLMACRVLGLAPVAVMIHSAPEKGCRASAASQHRPPPLPITAWASPRASEQRGAETQQQQHASLTLTASPGSVLHSQHPHKPLARLLHTYQQRYVFKLGLRKASPEEMQQLTEPGLPYLARRQTGSPRHSSSSSDSVSPSGSSQRAGSSFLLIPGGCSKAPSLLFLFPAFFFV